MYTMTRKVKKSRVDVYPKNQDKTLSEQELIPSSGRVSLAAACRAIGELVTEEHTLLVDVMQITIGEVKVVLGQVLVVFVCLVVEARCT